MKYSAEDLLQTLSVKLQGMKEKAEYDATD